jgi:two-component system chemotaxis response regulator CheY
MLNISDLYILLVEPSHMQSKFIIQHLEDAGVGSVKCVVTGKEALECIALDKPDLVISSMYFSDMTGIDLVSTIRENHDTDSLPFMLISSESSFRMLEPIRQAGVIAILPKPFTDEDLNRALKATIHYIDPGELELELFEVENLKVLVVDDSKLSQKNICNVITQMGVRDDHIVTALNGKEAISYFEQTEFDLVITDLNMPVMDGNELIEYIRNESSQSYVPVMMVTSESNKARLEHLQQAGVSAICDKPFEAANVKNLLSNILND